jgi:hypothetical protein
VGLIVVLQDAEVIVPALSHPQELEEATVRLVTNWPLFWKSLLAAVVIPVVSAESDSPCAP